ncbi:MAG: nicotinate phosphoribosyltransferase [Nanoarchaeota archaeon]
MHQTHLSMINPAMCNSFSGFIDMAAYVENGKADEIATFNLYYRKNPFNGSFTIFSGLEDIIHFLDELHLTGNDIDFLRKQFNMPPSFFEYMREIKFDGDLEAMTEGSMAQPNLPIIQVTAPLPIASFIGNYLKNQIGFATLVSSKAARISLAGEHPFIEGGITRVQGGVEGSVIAARSAYIGGSAGTTNVLAAQLFGIPLHYLPTHDGVLAFNSETDSFRAYATIMGDKSVFVIDTYEYIEGTYNAISAAGDISINNFALKDDSGDLADHSQVVRMILDKNGYHHVKIIVSENIDEEKRKRLKEAGACIDIDAPGTKLVTADGTSSLGIVYRMVQLGDSYVIKLSGDKDKISTPGKKMAYRYSKDDKYFADGIFAVDEPLRGIGNITNSIGYGLTLDFMTGKSLLIPIFKKGNRIYRLPELAQIRSHALGEIALISDDVKKGNHDYFVGLGPILNKRKKQTIEVYSRD